MNDRRICFIFCLFLISTHLLPYILCFDSHFTFYYDETPKHSSEATPAWNNCTVPSNPCSSIAQIRNYLNSTITETADVDIVIFLMSNLTHPDNVGPDKVNRMNLTISSYESTSGILYYIGQHDGGVLDNIDWLASGCEYLTFYKIRMSNVNCNIGNTRRRDKWIVDSCIIDNCKINHYGNLLTIQNSQLVISDMSNFFSKTAIQNSTFNACNLDIHETVVENSLFENSNFRANNMFLITDSKLKATKFIMSASQQVEFTSTLFENSTVLLRVTAAIIMKECQVLDNSRLLWVGFDFSHIQNVYFFNNSTIVIEGGIRSVFKGANFTQNFNALIAEQIDTLDMVECQFIGNRQPVSLNNNLLNSYTSGTVTFKNSLFRDNWAEKGGALYLINNSNTINLQSCLFINNRAANGGAIYTQNSIIWDSASTFLSNEALTNFEGCIDLIRCGNGGAIYSENMHFISINSKFQNNIAVKGGVGFGDFRIIASSENFGNIASYSGNFAYLRKDHKYFKPQLNEGIIPLRDLGSGQIIRVLWRVIGLTQIHSSSDELTWIPLYPGQLVTLEVLQIMDDLNNTLTTLQQVPIITSLSKSTIISNRDQIYSNNSLIELSVEWFDREQEVKMRVELAQFPYKFDIGLKINPCPFDYSFDGPSTNRICTFKNYTAIILSAVFGFILMCILFAGGVFATMRVGKRLFKLHKKEKREFQIAKKMIDKQFIFGDGLTPLLSNIQTMNASNILIPIEDIEIVRRIGEGTQGSVYLASWNGTKVAVKSLKTEDNESNDLINDEFEHEASLLNSLRHPAIVRFYGISVGSTAKYMIVEYMENGSLENAIMQSKIGRKKLSLKKKIEILLGISKGMDYLHSLKPRSLIHRDLKAGNVLLDSDMEPKICDFGLSKMTSNSGTSSMTMNLGTLLYMAPELVGSGHEIGSAIDVYSFSIIMYELFFEEKPFFSNSEKMNKFSSQTNHQQDQLFSIPVMVVKGERPKIPWNDRNELEIWIKEYIEPTEKKILNSILCDTSDQFVELMKSCWDNNPQNRPNFKEITQILRDLHSNFE